MELDKFIARALFFVFFALGLVLVVVVNTNTYNHPDYGKREQGLRPFYFFVPAALCYWYSIT